MSEEKNKYYGRKELLRYSIIVPLINDTNPYSSVDEYCRAASKKSYEYEGRILKFTSRTIKGWYYNYLKNGLSCLEKHKRSDQSKFRKIKDDSVEDYIIELRKKYPRITTKSIYEKLLENNYLTRETSIYCIFRYLRNNNLKATEVARKEKRKYEQEYPNDCWQADTSSGPYIVIGGVKYKTYLISVIDDTSRLIVGYGFFLHDNAINMQKVLKKAMKTYGIPKKLYVDNGSPYKNEQLSIIMARLGVALIHAKPYSPTGKGKVERSFRTIKDGWMNCTDWNEFRSIEDEEKSFSNFLYNNYQNKIHGETKETPNNRFHRYYDRIKRLENSVIEESFMHTKYCKVYNNGTIRLNNDNYHVPYKYAGKKIEVRYRIDEDMKLYVYEGKERKEELKKVERQTLNDNAKILRKDNIDYSKLVNKEEDVMEEIEYNE